MCREASSFEVLLPQLCPASVTGPPSLCPRSSVSFPGLQLRNYEGFQHTCEGMLAIEQQLRGGTPGKLAPIVQKWTLSTLQSWRSRCRLRGETCFDVAFEDVAWRPELRMARDERRGPKTVDPRWKGDADALPGQLSPADDSTTFYETPQHHAPSLVSSPLSEHLQPTAPARGGGHFPFAQDQQRQRSTTPERRQPGRAGPALPSTPQRLANSPAATLAVASFFLSLVFPSPLPASAMLPFSGPLQEPLRTRSPEA